MSLIPTAEDRAYSRGFEDGKNSSAENIFLELKNRELCILLKQIAQWDMLDTTTDGNFWKQEINKVLTND